MLCGFIPGTYACSLLRYAFLETPVSQLVAYAESIGISPEIISQLYSNFGYELNFFGIMVNPQWQAFVLTVFILLFLGLNIGAGKKLAEVLGIGRKKRKKH